jgi:hypothetical protein
MSAWMIALEAYVAVGFILVFVGPAARQLRRDRMKLEAQVNDEQRWKVRVLACTMALAIIVLWPVLAVSAARTAQIEAKTLWDAVRDNPAFKKQNDLFEAMSLMCEDGVDADEMPNGRGEFGLVPSNPIPCKTVFGSTAYLARLRTPEGIKVVYTRKGSVISDVSRDPVDAYEISFPNGGRPTTLFISPYQKRISRKAPRGFALAD